MFIKYLQKKHTKWTQDGAIVRGNNRIVTFHQLHKIKKNGQFHILFTPKYQNNAINHAAKRKETFYASIQEQQSVHFSN
jgi:hypothetical protein